MGRPSRSCSSSPLVPAPLRPGSRGNVGCAITRQSITLKTRGNSGELKRSNRNASLARLPKTSNCEPSMTTHDNTRYLACAVHLRVGREVPVDQQDAPHYLLKRCLSPGCKRRHLSSLAHGLLTAAYYVYDFPVQRRLRHSC